MEGTVQKNICFTEEKRVVLRDRLGQCLVGLKREQQIDSLRDLGLVCLTRAGVEVLVGEVVADPGR
jgi:hypothetical protein